MDVGTEAEEEGICTLKCLVYGLLVAAVVGWFFCWTTGCFTQ